MQQQQTCHDMSRHLQEIQRNREKCRYYFLFRVAFQKVPILNFVVRRLGIKYAAEDDFLRNVDFNLFHA